MTKICSRSLYTWWAYIPIVSNKYSVHTPVQRHKMTIYSLNCTIASQDFVSTTFLQYGAYLYSAVFCMAVTVYSTVVSPTLESKSNVDIQCCYLQNCWLKESKSTVHVMVHDIRPLFLDGQMVFTKQFDSTSDMAVFSKEGCVLLNEKREEVKRAKALAKLTSRWHCLRHFQLPTQFDHHFHFHTGCYIPEILN